MGNRIKVGIPIVGGKAWFGGVAIVEHLIKALASLTEEADLPLTYLVVSEQTLKSFPEYEAFAGSFNGVIYVGQEHERAMQVMNRPIRFVNHISELFSLIDVMFPVSMGVLPGQCSVSWIDDFQHRRLPHFFPQQVIQQRDETLAKVAEQARVVAFHTRDVKNDFQTYYPESKAVLKVLTYRVRQEPEWVAGDPVAVQKKYQLPDEFLMCSNQFWMHKNHKCLFEAIALLKKTGRVLHVVCTGHTGDFRNPEYFPQLMEAVRGLGIEPQVHILGLIPRVDQIQLLRRSLLVIQPSLFEGLGFIVQECVALGKHIVLTDLEAHKEQASEYTHFYDQTDPVSLARQVELLLRSGLQPGPCREEEERARRLAEKNVKIFGRQFIELARFAKELFVDREKTSIEATAETARRDTWTAALRRFDAEQTERKKTDPNGAAAAADEFLLTHLRRIQPEQAVGIFPRLMEQWMLHRRLPHRFGALTPAEMQRMAMISKALRFHLVNIVQGGLSGLGQWSERQQQQCVSLWRVLFLNPFAPLELLRDSEVPPPGEMTQEKLLTAGLVRSLFLQPSPVGADALDVRALFQSPAPGFLKVILCCWLMKTAYFGVAEDERLRARLYSRQICEVLSQPGEKLSFGAFATIMEELMASFWRISYAGGDQSRELCMLGDFISLHMNQLFPQPQTALPVRTRASLQDAGTEPLRIGYISRNLCKQAVSFYMVNRLIHHDRSRFSVHTFAAGDRDDELTEVFRQNSEEFIRHPQLSDMSGMIAKIRERRLDILIYADLGMDPFTLMLAGLRLAPLQCVLVGHGVTSGMKEIDYYISGDFEPADAQAHYREKLIRLPNLGAAQYPPYEPERLMTRQEYKIPDDAVVYVSCANGIKLHPDRDRLFLEILRRVPNAWLLLKPFQSPDAVDPRFMERIFGPAREAGVADRVLIAPPFRQAKDVLGLLAIADIQLDTYPYGGWTTNMEAVYMGMPLVTQEGDMARSRWGPAMLRAMGIGEGIAASDEEYVEWAVRFGTDRELLGRVRARVREKARPVFFDGAAAQPAYEEMLLNCYLEKTGAL